MLTADSHVHSEWSWDTGGPLSAARGTMQRSCAQAVRIGLPTVIFTEHLDFARWRADPADFPAVDPAYLDAGYLTPPPLDVAGYFDAIDSCRSEFPSLTILTGVEFGQPHLFEEEARALADLDRFDRINGSLHTLPVGDVASTGGAAGTVDHDHEPQDRKPGDRAAGDHVAGDRAEPVTLYRLWPAERVMTCYLDHIPIMVAGSEVFEVVTHLDYAARYWPTEQAGPFDPTQFEDGFRAALRAIADSGRALEMNTQRLWPWLPRWWREEGGRAVTFGSDAHTPDVLARGFPEAMEMLDGLGFHPGRRPRDFWTC